jgi:invasion protein IalB
MFIPPNLTRFAAIAATGLALAGPGLAQDTAAPAAAPAEADAEAAPPTLETAEIGQVFLAETAEPWELRCTKVETGQGPCQIFQLLRDDSGGAVAEFNMFEIPDGNAAAAGAVVVVPLETMLESGLIIQVDDKAPRAYPFAFCNSYGCIARPGFTTEELGWMKAGNKAVLTIVPAMAPEAKVNLTLSLKGFTAMLAKTKQPG